MSTAVARPLLSATVITFNEADRLVECLASLAFCDELLVVDSGSTDGTRELAEAAGARVLVRPFDGYRSQKQYAVEQAAHDWILSLDADERVTPELRASIEAARARGFADAAGYEFARSSYYFGRFLRHGDAYPDRKLRLFDRRRGGWRGAREIHETATVDGAVARLDGDLQHWPYRSLDHQLGKSHQYAQMMAEHAHAQGKRASLARMLLAPLGRLVGSYLLRGGFRDGAPGLLYALVTANYAREKVIRLWLLQRGLAARGRR